MNEKIKYFLVAFNYFLFEKTKLKTNILIQFTERNLKIPGKSFTSVTFKFL